jgi:hypothetical protein
MESVDRKKIMKRAYDECMCEMYIKAQPSVDYKQLMQDVKDGKIEDTPQNPIYNRYYLSNDEFEYILYKYIDAYGFKKTWEPNIELLEQYLNDGGNKDIYIEEYVDENGITHTGHRGYESVYPIKKQINNLLKLYNSDALSEILSKKITNIVMNTIKCCKEYYSFDMEETQFCTSIALGPSPCSNKNIVKEYWKSQGVDIEIEDRDPSSFDENDEY